MKDIEKILLECNNLIDNLKEIKNAFLELCGEDDEICFQEAKEALNKLQDVRDFIESCI